MSPAVKGPRPWLPSAGITMGPGQCIPSPIRVVVEQSPLTLPLTPWKRELVPTVFRKQLKASPTQAPPLSGPCPITLPQTQLLKVLTPLTPLWLEIVAAEAEEW